MSERVEEMDMQAIMGISIAMVLVVFFILIAGCDDRNQYAAPPPPTVTVMNPLQETVTDMADFTGKTDAVESVEIRARVSGFLQEIHFQPSQMVEEGDLLFTIDPQPYEAALANAKAMQLSHEATLTRMEAQYQLVKTAHDKDAATPVELIKARADRDAAAADVEAAKAAVLDAEINLGYTQVRTPISGRINRHLVDVGNLVGQSDPTLMANVVKNQPIYVYFEVNERQLLDYLAKRPKAEEPNRKRSDVYLLLSDGRKYSEPGHADYADNRVNPTTGTIEVRAVFPNAEDELIPGLFVRLMIPSDPMEALLVPEYALQRDLAGYYLLVVNEKSEVERRNVKRGPLIDGRRVIAEGVDANERVIVAGLQRAREGIAVNAVTAEREEESQENSDGGQS